MSKLSQPLKTLISASFARPGMVAAPKQIRSVYSAIEEDANARGVGRASWLTISTAATMTMNSPESLAALYHTATLSGDTASAVQTAELMREVGLKCISFNGIPRTINCLGAFRSSLPEDVVKRLSTKETRQPSPQNLAGITERGNGLWKSIYTPFDEKLISKLSDSHPDLPVHILNSHYGPLLSDPSSPPPAAKVGRVLTSVVAISCLRAQTGVGPQVTSHIFGLRKAYEDGSYKAQGEEEIEGGEWLASNEGSLWILESVDKVVEAIGGGNGTTFAPGIRSKL
ncbi:AhpD-like protein [Coleophoma cylindrospora]|uniref:AhpD-like protein n=1 Tax=Coleophoma cylindrospora TaxID=1849047 RepID=A0A3D8S858_9HELO|nr:AhpD-like protein [Coleophoma cylindrospora]